MEPIFYSFLSEDIDIYKASSSGGAFTVITDYLFDNFDKVIVYGCCLNDQFEAVHIRATSKAERDCMRGSKYIGSNMSNIYTSVAEDLTNDNYVVFTGTPCQIAALLKYLSVRKIDAKDRLLTVEVICHGVGSTSFFKDYLKYYEDRYKSRVIDCKFRGKSNKDSRQDFQLIFENGKIFNSFSTNYDLFYSFYCKDYYLIRPSCFNCMYAKPERLADISLADLWEEDVSGPAKSLVVVNSEIGLAVWKSASLEKNCHTVDKKLVHQPHMYAPCEKPVRYEEFWGDYLKYGFKKTQKVFGNLSAEGCIKRGIGYFVTKVGLKRIVKRVIKWMK